MVKKVYNAPYAMIFALRDGILMASGGEPAEGFQPDPFGFLEGNGGN